MKVRTVLLERLPHCNRNRHALAQDCVLGTSDDNGIVVGEG
jgi:hypothetical protein